jgi:hypothetical protein
MRSEWYAARDPQSMQTSANSEAEFGHALSFVANPRLTDERESSLLRNVELRSVAMAFTNIPDPDDMNLQRALWAKAALREFAIEVSGPQALSDMRELDNVAVSFMCDLAHLADERRWEAGRSAACGARTLRLGDRRQGGAVRWIRATRFAGIRARAKTGEERQISQSKI